MDVLIKLSAQGDKQVKTAFDELQRSLKATGASIQTVSSSLEKTNAGTLIALQQINKAAGDIKNALENFTGKAIQEFIDFEDALTSVDAKANLTEAELLKLKDAVRVTALETSQSPTSALKAADALVALGASADKAADRVLTVAQLTDALRGVGATAEQSAKAIQLGAEIFEDFGETAQSVGDKIALISDTSAVASSTGLDEFLQVFSKAAPLASELGINLDELLANFAVLRDAGQAPEVAATSLKSLLGTILKNKDALKELGVDVEDSNGKFLKLEEIFRQIGERGTSATEIVDLFGKIGVSSALTLSKSYDDVNEATNRLANSQGALQAKSDAINSSLKGQIKLLEGSLQTALVEIGESLATVIAPGVEILLDLVNAFVRAPKPVKDLIGVSAGLATAFAGVVFALTSATLAYKAYEAAQVGATLSAGKVAIAEGAKAIALRLAAAAGDQNAIATLKVAAANATAAKASAGAATAAGTQAGVNLTLAGSFTTLATAVGAAVGILGAFAAALALGDLVKTTGELRNLRNEVESLGKGGEATFAATLQIAKGLKSTNEEINSLREKGAKISDELLDKQRQQKQLAQEQLDDVRKELAIREQILRDIEAAGTGRSDVPILAGLSKEAQEAVLNNLRAQVGEYRVQVSLLEAQIGQTGEIAGNTADTAANAADVAENAEDAVSAFEKLNDALDIDLGKIGRDATNALIKAYEDFGDNKEALEEEITAIESQELDKRLARQIQHLKELRETEFESDAERKKAIADAEDEVSQTRLEIRRRASDELIAIAEAEAEAQAELEEEFRAVQVELAEQAFQEKQTLLDRETQALESALDDRIAAQNAAIESIDDQSDALNQQLEVMRLIGEQNELLGENRLTAIDNEIEALRTVQDLSDGQIDNSERILELEEQRRQEVEDQLLAKQEIEDAELNFQQQLKRLDLDRQVRQAQINAIEAEREVIQARQLAKSQELELSEQNRLITAAQLNGAKQSEIIQLEAQRDLVEESLRLSNEGIGLAQESAKLAAGEVDDAKRAREQYEDIAVLEKQNLEIKQEQSRESLKATQESERTASAIANASDNAEDLEANTANVKSTASDAADEFERGSRAIKDAVSATETLSKLQGKTTNQARDIARAALKEGLPGLKKVSTTGQPTQYFIGDREVSEEEYNAEKAARKELKDAAKKSTVGRLTQTRLTEQGLAQATSEELKQAKATAIREEKNLRNFFQSQGLIFKSSDQTIKYFQDLDKAYVAALEREKQLQNAEELRSAEALLNIQKEEAEVQQKFDTMQQQLRDLRLSESSLTAQRLSGDKVAQAEYLLNQQKITEEQAKLNDLRRTQIQQEGTSPEARQAYLEAENARKEAIAQAEADIIELKLANLELVSKEAIASAEQLRQTQERLDLEQQITDEKERQSELSGGVQLVTGIPRRLGGTVSPGNLYQVNEAGMESFKPAGSNSLIPLTQPANSLFSPRVPGTIIPALQTSNILSMGGLLQEIQGLRKDLASRPAPVLNAPATFVNEPSPLAAQIQLLTGQMKAMRNAI